MPTELNLDEIFAKDKLTEEEKTATIEALREARGTYKKKSAARKAKKSAAESVAVSLDDLDISL